MAIIIGNSTSELLIGTPDGDLILGEGGEDTLLGLDGDDILDGGDDADIVEGGGGNDTISGGAGADTLSGNEGDDTYLVDDLDSIVKDTGGIDTVVTGLTIALNNNYYLFKDYKSAGTIENVVLTGSADINATGNGLDNVLVGNDGNNTLNGGAGADTAVGGLGNDLYIVDRTEDQTIELADEGIDTVQLAATFVGSTYTLMANVENYKATGTQEVDGIGNSLGNYMVDNNKSNELSGLDGDDYLAGRGGSDTLVGGNGNDTLDGGAGFDSMSGGAGDDRIVVGHWNETSISGGSGIDVVVATSDFIGAGYDLSVLPDVEDLNLSATTGELYGYGNNLKNRIVGNNDANLLMGGSNNDTLVGGGGDDELLGGTGHDVLNGGAGQDSMYGEAGNDTIVYSPDDAEIDGGAGSDLLIASDVVGPIDLANADDQTLGDNAVVTNMESVNAGGSSNNLILNGNSAANTLIGGSGNDQIDGRAGADVLDGGDGNDKIVYDEQDTRADGGAGTDTLIVGVASGRVVIDLDAEDQTLDDTVRVSNFERVNASTNTTGVDIYGFDAKDDSLTGGKGDDRLFGRGGNDTLTGNLGKDELDGGEGNDLVNLSSSTVYATGGDGNDTVTLAAAGNVKYIDLGDLDNQNRTGIFFPDFSVPVLNLFQNVDGSAASFRLEIEGDDKDNVLIGGLSNDWIDGEGGNDTLIGNKGNDEIFGDDGDDLIDGGEGDDVLEGGAGIDVILGGSGDDLIIVEDQADFLDDALVDGGAGYDVLAFFTGFQSVNLPMGAISTLRGIEEILFDNFKSNSIVVSDVDNFLDNPNLIIRSTGLADALFVDASTLSAPYSIEVHLEESNENDTILGGAGDDSVYFDEEGSNYGDIVDGNEGIDVIYVTEDEFNGIGAIQEVEAIVVQPEGQNDPFTDTYIDFDGSLFNPFWAMGTSNPEFLLIDGLVLDASADRDFYVFGDEVTATKLLILSGEGEDVLFGGTQADTIYGNGSDDYIEGGAGFDLLDGGDGNDEFGYSSLAELTDGVNSDTVIGGAGLDLIEFDFGQDMGPGLLKNTSGIEAWSIDLTDFDDIALNDDDLANNGDKGSVLAGLAAAFAGDFPTGAIPVGYLSGEGADQHLFAVIMDQSADDWTVSATGVTDPTTGVLVSYGNDNNGDDFGVFGGAGDDVFYVYEVGAQKFLDFSLGNDFFVGNGGHDTLVVTEGFDIDLGGALTNTFFAEEIHVEATNLGFATTIDFEAGWANASVLIDGSDLGSGSPLDVDASVNISGEDVNVIGGAGNDTFLGGDGNDSFVGNNGADTVQGGRGQDDIDFSETVAARDYTYLVSIYDGAGFDDGNPTARADDVTGFQSGNGVLNGVSDRVNITGSLAALIDDGAFAGTLTWTNGAFAWNFDDDGVPGSTSAEGVFRTGLSNSDIVDADAIASIFGSTYAGVDGVETDVDGLILAVGNGMSALWVYIDDNVNQNVINRNELALLSTFDAELSVSTIEAISDIGFFV